MVRPQFKRKGEVDRQLEDLVKASSWKQAITLCEKRIKKGDKSDAALVRATDSSYSWLWIALNECFRNPSAESLPL